MKFLSAIDEKQSLLTDLSDYIWEHPEIAFHEYLCAEKLQTVLREEGFTVESGLAGIPTAFSGRFGHGKPVIGILGEFDALPKLSQKAGITHAESLGKPCGHGCGHNLLGTASLGAALGVKKYLEDSGVSGTVIFFGCPAEEGGSAKTFMARDGVFDELDAALCWHPDDLTGVRARTYLANCQVLYKFDGVSAHAGKQPHLGRSALDAVELMNVGVNYLREHIITSARVHYAVTDTGGLSPNVVQAHAEVLYLIRAPKNEQVAEIYARINDIAKGAALMTGTRESHTFIKACSGMVQNCAIERIIYEKMQRLPPPVPNDDDLDFAVRMLCEGLSQCPTDVEHPLHYELSPYDGSCEEGFGSTDVSDVSWVCPTAQIMAATHAFGTPNHSWQQTAQGKTPWAHKMTLYVAKILAATAVELIASPERLSEAQREHKTRIGAGYVCPIPAGVRPQI